MILCSFILPVLKVYLIGLKVLLYQLFNQSFTLPVLPKQNGRVAIVTGGAKGMGYETSRHLTRLGMRVIIAGNSEEEGLAAVRRIQEEDNEGEAAVMLAPEGRTEDGFELHFGINYLGHFLLTNLLLDTLKRSGTHDSHARVVTVSSATHHIGVLNMLDLQSRSCYSAHGAYSQSKLALVMFTYHLQHKLNAASLPVTANAVDPGMVDTDLYQHLCTPARLLKKPVAWLLFRTPAEGASTTMYAATAPEIEGIGGSYLYNGRRTQSSHASYDEELQAQLWRQSCALVGLREEGSRAN